MLLNLVCSFPGLSIKHNAKYMAAEPMQVELDQSDSIHLIPDVENKQYEKSTSKITVYFRAEVYSP